MNKEEFMKDEAEQPQLKAFVLMPFDPEFNDIYDNLIKPALKQEGYKVSRADNILNQQNILKDIVRGIAQADLVIADLTSMNPNVFYELGISHTMQRPTVLLMQSVDDVPFDLKSYRVIKYSVHFSEAPKLSQELKKIIAKAKNGNIEFSNPVSDFLPEIKDRYIPPANKTKKSFSKKEDKKKVKYEEEEKGLWDFVLENEKSMMDITKSMKKMTEATREIGEKMKIRTSEMEKISQSKILGTSAKIHKLATDTSIDITRYAKILEIEQPKLHRAWELFNENTTGFIRIIKINTDDDKETVSKFYSSVDGLRSSLRVALQGLKKYKGAVLNLRGISRDINRASKRTEHILALLISDLEMADSYSTKILTLMDEKIRGNGVGTR